jgi:hypothetical protein
MNPEHEFKYQAVIADICNLGWSSLSSEEMVSATWAYYYFSIQFRESLRAARSLYPNDDKLMQLEREECDTDNLAPWPGVAAPGEKMNHDEFMRRTLDLYAVEPDRARELDALGQAYLSTTRAVDIKGQAASIASYEDGGLENVFKAILGYSRWDNPMLQAFQHFLSEHIRFDSDPDQGHGALSRHITVDDTVLPLWQAFKDVLVRSVPNLLPRVGAPALQVAAE